MLDVTLVSFFKHKNLPNLGQNEAFLTIIQDFFKKTIFARSSEIDSPNQTSNLSQCSNEYSKVEGPQYILGSFFNLSIFHHFSKGIQKQILL